MSLTRLQLVGTSVVLLGLLGGVLDARAEVTSGTYTGNGANSRQITGAGFRPEVVIIKGDVTATAVIRTATMPAGMAKQLAQDATLQADCIRNFGADGFEVGGRSEVNASGVTYAWVAFSAAPTELKTGTYTGNGNILQNVTGIGFQPELVFVLPGHSSRPYWRSSSMLLGQSMPFDNAALGLGYIGTFLTDGFQVAWDADVNQNGVVYHYVAWNATAEGLALGNYTGNGNASQSVSLAFKPEWVLVKSGNNRPAVQKPRALSTQESGFVTADRFTNEGIQALLGFGFRVGEDRSVNEEGRTYYYAAFDDRAPTSADVTAALAVDDATPDELQSLTYTLTITNQGPDDATALRVQTSWPAGLQVLGATGGGGAYHLDTGVWDLGNLGAGSSASLTVTARPVAGTAGQTLTATANVVTVAQVDPVPENNAASAAVVVASSDLAVSLGVSDATPDEGQLVTLDAAVTNAGPSANSGVVATVSLPAGLTYQSHAAGAGTFDHGTGTWTIGDLAVGATATLQIQAVVAAGTGGSTLTAAADLVAADRADLQAANDAARASMVVTSADLAISLTADDVNPDQGDPVGFTLTLSNHGPDAAGGITVVVGWPPELAYVSSTPGSGSYDDVGGVWTVPALPAGAVTTLQIATTVAGAIGGANLVTTAAVTAATPSDPVAANNLASVAIGVTSADLAVAVAVSDATPDELQPITFTVSLTNLGPDDASGVVAAAALPVGMTPGGSAVDAGSYDPDTGAWNLANLAVGATATLILTASAAAGTAGAELTLLASVSASVQADPVVANNAASRTVTVTSADLRLDLTADDLTPDVGQAVIFDLTLTNGGPDAATGAVVAITLPEGLAFAGSDGSFDNATDLWSAGGVAAGAAAHLRLTATVAAGMGGTTLVTSAAVTSADQGDPVEANDGAQVAVVVTLADLAVTAGFEPAEAPAGGTTVLRVGLANAGPDAATAVVVRVTLPAPLAVAGVEPGTGSFDVATGAWRLASLAAGAADTLAVTCAIGAAAVGLEAIAEATVTRVDQMDPEAGNDAAEAILTINAVPSLYVAARTFADTQRQLLPGGAADAVLSFDVINTAEFAAPLTAITVHDLPAHDGAWARLDLRHRVGNADVPLPGAAGVFVAGTLTFDHLELAIAPGDTLHLDLYGAAALDAPDGLQLTPYLEGDDALAVPEIFAVTGSWPVVANGTLAVDGMTAAQIVLHPVGAEVFQIGSVRNLAFDVTLPGNGDAADHLTRFNVLNQGTAAAGVELTGLELWADDGDGVFDAAGDTRIAPLTWTGDRWEATGLSQEVPAAGLRVLVTADVAEDALDGSVMLGLPAGDDTGVGMASGNDGPIDEPVINPYAQTISATDRVIATAAAIASTVVAPGQADVPLLHLVARNLYADSRSLTRLEVRNVGQGGDAAVAELTLRQDGNGDGVLGSVTEDPVVGTAVFSATKAVFAGLDCKLQPGAIAHLFLTADVSLSAAADGDSLAAVVGGANDLSFDTTVALVGAWPLDSHARHRVDGMVAAQVANHEVPPVSLTAGEGPVLAFDLHVPGNGDQADTLTQLRLTNEGSATVADIDALQLWADDGDGLFAPATDLALGALAGVGRTWVAPDLDLAIPPAGRRLFAGLTVSAAPSDSATVQFSLPVDGATVTSQNDGPRDAAVTSVTSLLISTAPLLSNLQISSSRSTVGQTITVVMAVTNVSGETVTGIAPHDVVAGGEGGLVLQTGPTPPSFELASGADSTFTWTFQAVSTGDAHVRGRCSGIGAVGGQPRHSLATASGVHRILNPALALSVYPVANLPFSINRGQAGVVPLTLTLVNGGDDSTADIRLTRLVMTLDDGEDQPVVPADLLSRVLVNEGVNVYCNQQDLATSGQTVTLELNPAVVVTSREPVTLGLRLDIRPDTDIRDFRVRLLSAAAISACDHVSQVPVASILPSGSYPVSSGTGHLVAQATGLTVSGGGGPALAAGAGQEQVELLRLDLRGSGDPDFPTDVQIGAFTVALVDTDGRRLPDAIDHVRRLRVLGSFYAHAEATADSLVTFQLMPPVTVPVGTTAVSLRVVGQIPVDATLGPLQLRLESNATFDARDGNVGTPVPVSYDPAQVLGPVVTIQARATELAVGGTPQLPPRLTVGATGVLALTLHVAHPADNATAAVAIDTLRLACLGEARQPLDPAGICDRLRVTWRGETCADLPPPTAADGSIRIPLAGVRLAAGDAGDLQILCDLEAVAAAAGFELAVADTGLIARDVNLQTRVSLRVGSEGSWPCASGYARLAAPADELQVDVEDRLPPLLAGDGRAIEVARVDLHNSAVAGAGALWLTGLTLRGEARDLGETCAELSAAVGDDVWATATADSTVTLAGEQPLTIPAGESVVVTILARFRPEATGSLRLGLTQADVHADQPDGAVSPLRIRPAPGAAFPFWTQVGHFSGLDLATSYLNFPNPFAAGREATSFAFSLPQAAVVSLRILTARGEGVVTLLDASALAAGLHQDVGWDGRNGRGQTVINGVYLAELVVRYDDGQQTRLLRKVAVVR